MKKVFYCIPFLKRISLFKVLLVIVILQNNNGISQQNHFIYLQTDNNQPFSATINNQNYSSLGSGYLILPKISKGEYQITIGFAGNSEEEQYFNCTVNENDLGYSVKKFTDKGWGLFNLQTLGITMASSKTEKVEIKTKILPQEAKEIPVVDSQFIEKDKEIQPSSNKIVEKKVEDPTIQIQQPIKEDKIEEKPKTILSVVNKTGQLTSTDGLHLIFQDKLENSVDTIYALIPFINAIAKTEEKIIPNTKQEVDTIKKAKREMYNSACVSLATDDDFFKLRKKMASQTDDEKMIIEASKIYKTKCFDVQQIRNLSTLFLSDNGRYKFFESSINNVYDFVNFSNLEKELNEESFIKLFKNLMN